MFFKAKKIIHARVLTPFVIVGWRDAQMVIEESFGIKRGDLLEIYALKNGRVPYYKVNGKKHAVYDLLTNEQEICAKCAAQIKK